MLLNTTPIFLTLLQLGFWTVSKRSICNTIERRPAPRCFVDTDSTCLVTLVSSGRCAGQLGSGQPVPTHAQYFGRLPPP